MSLISRRSTLLGLAAGLTLPVMARADDLEKWKPLLTEVLARRFTGQASAPSSATETGTLVIDLLFNFQYAYGLISGDYRIQSTWDDETYTAFYSIDGGCWERDGHVGVRIDNTHYMSGDELPSGMYWQGLTGELEFFNDQTSPGSFILSGTMTGTQDYATFAVSIVG